jgi:amino-acid N-acetyltransferase
MTIVPASQNSFSAAIRLLESCGLPTQDINPGMQLFVMEDGHRVIGTIAAEYDYDHALLRSLSVDQAYRNKGIGEELVNFIESYVQKQGVLLVYIVTTTAAAFFEKRGYQKTERAVVPSFIQNTSEFRLLCPSSATVMRKSLSQNVGEDQQVRRKEGR